MEKEGRACGLYDGGVMGIGQGRESVGRRPGASYDALGRESCSLS